MFTAFMRVMLLPATVLKLRVKKLNEENRMKFVNRITAFSAAAALGVAMAGSAMAADYELVEENTLTVAFNGDMP